MMKSRDSLVRLKRFHVEERRRRLTQIETMINEFARMAADLDREIALEEQRAGIADQTHFAYPTYARAARGRRDNLLRSSGELRGQLDEAKAGLDEAIDELGKVQNLDGREKNAERGSELAEQSRSLTELGLRAARA
jgi:flagellar export protein FliJ